jgi:hypothetical protein
VSPSTSFVEQMRARANLGLLWSSIKWGALDLAIGFWGYSIIASPEQKAEAGAGLLGAAFLIGAVAGMVFIVRRATKRLSASEHPLNLELAAYGEPAAIARAIDAEFAGRPFAPHRVNLARQWLCYVRKTQVTVRWIDQLVWGYSERIRHRMNYFIPYRPASYQVILWDRSGRAGVLPVRKADAAPALEALHQAVPWMLVGYTEVLKESWNADRGEFLAVVDARRRSASSNQSAAGQA